MIEKLGRENLLRDKMQLACFFIQEILIGLLYIRFTATHLQTSTILGSPTAHRRTRLYAVKLRPEFTILNQLRNSLAGAEESDDGNFVTGNRLARVELRTGAHGSQRSQIEMVPVESQIRVKQDVVISTSAIR
ncbi:hypothetical protein T440DRAFT_475224 [Plenodomus tracheiphilus IPT5]|uniref:Uncharacterized protein n=1 Tax=Plenodomus tracheiphilus IPT5 TaxID=1408161 RepID=A0A6A7BK48_9PLEO|nr:hypothetical protein T440DRAFT_475224 [Plenodomus tracheiphilus IPT5]